MMIHLYFNKYRVFLLRQLLSSKMNAVKIYLTLHLHFSTDKNTGTAKIRLPFLWLEKIV